MGLVNTGCGFKLRELEEDREAPDRIDELADNVPDLVVEVPRDKLLEGREPEVKLLEDRDLERDPPEPRDKLLAGRDLERDLPELLEVGAIIP